ncbi:MAG: UDP-N-acetylmuramyl-tripeptide synthetase [Candidatus Pacebacteria bacterium]|nr:UDP-N-acetylmuramyl-tripeptide synthetase [Candidatus Paceibacterota bacterium]
MNLLNKIKKNTLLRKIIAFLAALRFGFPGRHLTIIGITGTTGKTTTAFMIKNILEVNGIKTGLISTAGYHIGNEVIYPKAHVPGTTPDPFFLHFLLRKMVRKGLKAVVIEVSSFGLMYERVYGLNFSTAILTNISYNHHIAFHGNMNNYVSAKLKLFRNLKTTSIAVLPKESKYFDLFAKNTQAQILSFGFDKTCDLWIDIKEITKTENKVILYCKDDSFSINLPLPGLFNILNALAAVGAVYGFSFSIEKLKKGLKSLKKIPGRLEYINGKQPFSIIVDKANTPTAFCGIIDFIKILNPKKKIAVYGNFGESPLKEREKLAEIATNFFDLTIITEDDPQEESSQKSINDFLDFVKKKNIPSNKYQSFLNRRQAIQESIKQANKGDLIIILGRGNEQTMDYGIKVTPFDDRQVTREVLRELGY